MVYINELQKYDRFYSNKSRYWVIFVIFWRKPRRFDRVYEEKGEEMDTDTVLMPSPFIFFFVMIIILIILIILIIINGITATVLLPPPFFFFPFFGSSSSRPWPGWSLTIWDSDRWPTSSLWLTGGPWWCVNWVEGMIMTISIIIFIIVGTTWRDEQAEGCLQTSAARPPCRWEDPSQGDYCWRRTKCFLDLKDVWCWFDPSLWNQLQHSRIKKTQEMDDFALHQHFDFSEKGIFSFLIAKE